MTFLILIIKFKINNIKDKFKKTNNKLNNIRKKYI